MRCEAQEDKVSESEDMNSNLAEPFFTIIVPVYNTVSYLRQCVHSILEQSFSSLELILIDDGSTDGSSELCNQFAREDVRVVVVHKQNSGVSAARNDGLDMATGSYVWFVDSDDWISPDALLSLSKRIADCGPDIVGFSFNTIDAINSKIATLPAPKDSLSISDGPLQCDCYLYAWSQVFRSNLVEGIKFDTGLTLLEDRDFFYKLYLKAAGNAVGLGKPIYNYRVERQGSAVNEVTIDKVIGAYRVSKEIYESEKSRGYLSPAYESMISHALFALSTIGKAEGKTADYAAIVGYLSKNRHEQLLSVANRLKLRLAMDVPVFFIALCRAKAALKLGV